MFYKKDEVVYPSLLLFFIGIVFFVVLYGGDSAAPKVNWVYFATENGSFKATEITPTSEGCWYIKNQLSTEYIWTAKSGVYCGKIIMLDDKGNKI